MTKEAILNKHDTSNKYIEQTCRPELFSAMDEYAKQQAIAFGEWIQGCNYAPATDDGKWQNQLPGENDTITTGELYSQFIENQRQITENK